MTDRFMALSCGCQAKTGKAASENDKFLTDSLFLKYKRVFVKGIGFYMQINKEVVQWQIFTLMCFLMMKN